MSGTARSARGILLISFGDFTIIIITIDCLQILLGQSAWLNPVPSAHWQRPLDFVTGVEFPKSD